MQGNTLGTQSTNFLNNNNTMSTNSFQTLNKPTFPTGSQNLMNQTQNNLFQNQTLSNQSTPNLFNNQSTNIFQSQNQLGMNPLMQQQQQQPLLQQGLNFQTQTTQGIGGMMTPGGQPSLMQNPQSMFSQQNPLLSQNTLQPQYPAMNNSYMNNTNPLLNNNQNSMMMMNNPLLNNPNQSMMMMNYANNNPLMMASTTAGNNMFSINPLGGGMNNYSQTNMNPLIQSSLINNNSMTSSGYLNSSTMMNPSMSANLTYNNPLLNNNQIQNNRMDPYSSSMNRSFSDRNLLFKSQNNMGKSIDDTFSLQERRNLLSTPSGLNSLLEGTSQKTREVYLSNHSRDFNELSRNMDRFDDPYDKFNPFAKSMRMSALNTGVSQQKNKVSVIVRRQTSFDYRRKNDEFSNIPHEFFIKPKLEMKKESGKG